ncbi:uncharacterized protein LOC136074177 [Hydra vulgaris]|uniref:Uncharacterized protein LOC136074177 n=1 Tax=Hydra vulgaris TaxID=6087 RepID=A0ABM4B192_HYDVU
MAERRIYTRNLGSIHILVLDWHTTHITLEAVLLCKKHNIILICLPEHSSQILQPLDRGIYCHVKQAWKEIFTKYYIDSKCKNLDKQNFPPLLKLLYVSGKCFTRLHVTAGFQYTDLLPRNKNNKNHKALAITQTFNPPTPSCSDTA